MKNLLFFLLIASLLTSCCRRNIHTSVKYEVRDSVSITTQTRYIDTTVHIDSSVSVVRIECDSNNKPQIISNTQTHGSKKTNFSQIDNNTFKIKCPADSLRLIVAFQDSVIRSYRTEKTDTTIVVEEKKGFWARFGEIIKHIGYAIFFMFLGAVVYALLKPFR